LRHYLLYQFGSSMMVGTSDPATTSSTSRPPSFLRNKAALILMQHILLDVPTDRWPTFLPDLCSHLAQSYPELFLKTCETLLEDFLLGLNQENQLAEQKESIRRVKDILKGYSTTAAATATSTEGSTEPRATPLEQLFGTTVHVLALSLQHSGENGDATTPATKELQVLALETIKAFFMWTELAFLGSEHANRALELLLLGFQPSRPSEVQLAALQAWEEWTTSASMNVGGGSDTSTITSAHDPKLPVMSAVLERLHESNLLPYTGESTVAEIEVVIEVAKLVNLFGLEIAPLRDSTLQQLKEGTSNNAPMNGELTILSLFNKILDMFFRGLNYDDIDVSGAVLPLASRLALTMEKEKAESSAQSSSSLTTIAGTNYGLRQHIPQILNIFYRQLKYPEDFDYDFEDDINAEEELYRTELTKLYVKLVTAAPEVCLQFVCEAAGQLLQASSNTTLSSLPTPDVEATLSLVFHYCEGVRPAPGVKVMLKNKTFVNLLSAIHNSDIASHPHEQVLCLYYDTAVRYCLFYKDDAHGELLSKLLDSISGSRGLQHAQPMVRSRCSYLFLRLVKSLVALLRPLVETAVHGISSLLTNSELELRPDDTLYLFETIGLLLGKTGLTPLEQQRYLTLVMTPHVQSIKNVLSTPGLSSDVEAYGESLSYSIAAIAYLSKGFAKQPSNEIQQVLIEATNIALEVLRALPVSDAVRNKVMVFLQRMIQSIGDKVLVPMPDFLALLIEHCTGDDILFVAQLINQTSIKFKERAAPAIDAALYPFLLKCDALAKALSASTTVNGSNNSTQSSTPTEIPPHLYTEQLSIQKLAFTVLHHIVMHNVTVVLTSPTNAGNLETTFTIVKEGATVVKDPVIQRTCLKFFRELLEQWGTAAATSSNGAKAYYSGLLTFCCQSLIPGVWLIMMEPTFDERDAQQSRNVLEFAQMLWMIQQQHGADTIQRSLTASGRWPNSCDPSLAAAADAKALETILQQAMKFKSMPL